MDVKTVYQVTMSEGISDVAEFEFLEDALEYAKGLSITYGKSFDVEEVTTTHIASFVDGADSRDA